MKILVVILSLCAIGFFGVAYAEPLAEIHPVTSLSKISTEPDGYLYFYDFDMDTHNQTITIQSVDFVINDTDLTLYNQGVSGVGVEGQNDIVPLTSLTLYMDESKVRFIYHYDKPMIFKPDSSNPKAKFTLNLFTPIKFDRNVGMSIRVYYLSNNGQQNFATSDVYEIHEFNPIQDQNQKILDELNVIKMQNAVLILEQAKANKLEALNFCKDVQNEGVIIPLDHYGLTHGQNTCVENILEWAK